MEVSIIFYKKLFLDSETRSNEPHKHFNNKKVKVNLSFPTRVSIH